MLTPALLTALAVPSFETVLVVPPTTRSTAEYQWIGHGVRAVLQAQLEGVNLLSSAELSAVLRRKDLGYEDLEKPAKAAEIARGLGASLVIVGSYQAAWPELQLVLRLVDTKDGRVRAEAWDLGHLEELIPMLEENGARLFASAGLPRPKPNALGTRNLYAFREAMLAEALLPWAALSPRGPPRVPEGTLRKIRLHCAEAVRRDPDWSMGQACAAAALALLTPVGSPDPKAKPAAAGDDAVAAAQRALAGKGSTTLAVLAAYAARWKKGDRAGAERLAEEAVAARPGELTRQLLLADHALQVDKPALAKAALEKALERAPDNPLLLVRLGKALSRVGEGPRAVAVTERALALSGEDAVAWVELGSRQIDVNQLDQAEQSLKKAIALDGRDGRAHLRLGYVYLLKKDPARAVAVLERSIVECDLEEEWRARALAHYDLARAHGQLGATDKAFQDLDLAIQNGFSDRPRAEAEPDLAALRKDPRWVALAARITAP